MTREPGEDDGPVPGPEVGADDRWYSLDPAALHGPVGAYLRALDGHSEADPCAVLVQLLAAFGNMIGRGPHFYVEGSRHALNLFVAVVGKTSRARKGTSLGRVLEVANLIDEPWSENNIMHGGLSSGQGLIHRVRDPSEAQNSKEKDDPGVMDKRLFVVEEELSKLFRIRKQDTSTIMEVLRTAWDGRTLTIATRNKPLVATNPHITVIGHTTRHELLSVLDGMDMANGVVNRFLWVFAERSRFLPMGGTDFRPNANQFRAAAEIAKKAGNILMTEACQEKWESIYAHLERDRDGGVIDEATGRSSPQVRRLACLYTLLDGCARTDVVHLDAALAVWDYCENTAKHLFECRVINPVAAKILVMLRKAGPSGLPRNEIRRGLSGHVEAPMVQAALNELSRRTLIRKIEAKTTDGRPPEVWAAVET